MGKRVYPISPQILEHFLSGKLDLVRYDSSCPDDIRIVGCFWDWPRFYGAVCLVCESDSFDGPDAEMENIPVESCTLSLKDEP